MRSLSNQLLILQKILIFLLIVIIRSRSFWHKELVVQAPCNVGEGREGWARWRVGLVVQAPCNVGEGRESWVRWRVGLVVQAPCNVGEGRESWARWRVGLVVQAPCRCRGRPGELGQVEGWASRPGLL